MTHRPPVRAPVATALPTVPRARLATLTLVAVVLALAVALTPAAASAQAEATTGVVRGTVRDPAGEPVAGAVVLIEHRETGFRTTVETTGEGTFARTLLPLGTYDVSVTGGDGFGIDRREGLVLRVGETLVLSLGLAPVELEGITVTRGRDVLLDTEDVTSSQRFPE